MPKKPRKLKHFIVEPHGKRWMRLTPKKGTPVCIERQHILMMAAEIIGDVKGLPLDASPNDILHLPKHLWNLPDIEEAKKK